MDLTFSAVTPVCHIARDERPYRGTKKPNSIDSASWRSMNRAEREGYVEAERREAEAKAMSREDTRDAASADVAYDSAYDSPAEKHQKDYDYWFHDPERRARFDPKSVTGCPVDPALLSDARVTMAMTDGTEFTLQDSWRVRDPRPLPCR